MPLIIDSENLRRLKERPKKAKRNSSGLRPPSKPERDFEIRMKQLWQAVLFPTAERIKEAVKNKATPAELASIIEATIKIAESQYNLAADDIVWRWRSAMDEETRAGLRRGLKHSLGVDISALLDTPNVKDALAVGGMEAANLIRSIPRQYLTQVAQAVSDNFTGKPLPEGRTLIQQLERIGGVSKKRAKFIARDQTAKMTAQLNQVRQQDLGIDTYIWRTVQDERVVGRPGGNYPEPSKAHGDHFHMNGKLCRWDDPTVYSKDGGKSWIQRQSGWPKNHPGQDINCRCHAEAVINVQKLIQQTRAA